MARKQFTPLDFNKNEIQNARVQNLAGPPSSPVSGQIFFDTADGNRLKYYDGAAWQYADGQSASIAFGTDVTTQAFGDAVSNGSGTTVTHSNHKHGMPAHGLGQHQELIATADLTDWPRTAALDLASQKLTSVADPTAAQDAATKNYVDGQVAGARDPKDNVRLATAAALPANTRSGNVLTASANGALTVDGVAVVANDRILVKNEATGANNGIYTVTATGGAGAAFVLTRSTDADASAEVTSGLYVWSTEGTANTDKGWLLTTVDPITLNTTALTFSQVSGLGQVTAGNGLTKTGDQLDVGAGTGVSVGADTVGIDTAVTARYKTATIGNGSSTSIAYNHAFGNQFVVAQAYDASTGAQVDCDVTLTDANNTTFIFATAPASNAIRIVVVG